MNEEVIIMPTEEEREQAKQEFKELLKWSRTLDSKQIDFLCDSGFYNNAMRGYLIATAKNAGFTKEQTEELLSGLNNALSDLNKADAEAVNDNY